MWTVQGGPERNLVWGLGVKLPRIILALCFATERSMQMPLQLPHSIRLPYFGSRCSTDTHSKISDHQIIFSFEVDINI